MTMVANMEQGQPETRHFGEHMSIVAEQISDAILQVPDTAQRFRIFDSDDIVRDIVSETSERSRTCSVSEHEVD
jgi:hypothetical protein